METRLKTVEDFKIPKAYTLQRSEEHTSELQSH